MTAAAFSFRFLPRAWRSADTTRAADPMPGFSSDEWASEQDRREFALGLMETHPDGLGCGESLVEAMFYISGRH